MRVCDAPDCGQIAIARVDIVQDMNHLYENTISKDVCGKHFHDIQDMLSKDE